MKSRALWAEFIGTFAFVFIGIMVVATGTIEGAQIGSVGIALAHGFAIAVMASATMAISGGHLNPAVSFAMWVGKRMTFKRMLAYWVVQLLGAAMAGLVVAAVIPGDYLINVNGAIPTISPELLPSARYMSSDEVGGISGWVLENVPVGAVLVEIVLTFILAYTVLGTGADWRAHKVGGLFIGLAVTLGILAGGPLTGAAMNPSRWFGSAFYMSAHWYGAAYDHWIVYVLGPLMGGALAAYLYGRIPQEQIAPGVRG